MNAIPKCNINGRARGCLTLIVYTSCLTHLTELTEIHRECKANDRLRAPAVPIRDSRCRRWSRRVRISARGGKAVIRRIAAGFLSALMLALTLTGCGVGISPIGTARTAEEVVTALAARIPTMKPSVVFTADTDPNKILGRPGGYTSKQSFSDTRIPADNVIGAKPGAVEYGGSVEVFDSEQAAGKRKAYVDSFSGIQLAVEYSWVSGPVLLRVSRQLTPTQASEYQKALDAIG